MSVTPPLRWMTYNIHKASRMFAGNSLSERMGRRLDWRFQFGCPSRKVEARVSSLIERISPQVAGLQEVRNEAQLRRIEPPGYRAYFGRTNWKQGNALLIHESLANQHNHRNLHLGSERRVLGVDFEFDGRTVTAYTTHLDSKLSRFEPEFDALMGILMNTPNPYFIMGDFNPRMDVGTGPRIEFERSLSVSAATTELTNSTWNPTRNIDNGFFSSHFVVEPAFAGIDNTSDHAYVTGEASIKPEFN